jgi:DNA (cytosine-5)-methyltransferase 1
MLGRTPVDWLFCRDGKWRPVEPGTFPLVDAYRARVGVLRAAGNALDAETATVFCTAVREIVDGV